MSGNFDNFPESKRNVLLAWARRNQVIRRVYIFGSWAKGTARPSSDLDIAVALDEIHGNQLSELIMRRSAWKAELTALLGITVKDLELADEPDTIAFGAVREHGILMYERDT